MTATNTPPPAPNAKRPHPRLQFNTATLLGVMALVAVVCALAVSVRGMFAVFVGLVLDAVVVGYAAVLVAGAWLTSGRRRLFCISAGASLIIASWGAYGLATALNSLSPSGIDVSSWGISSTVFIRQFQQITLSLFGGWVALAAARYWEPDSVERRGHSLPDSAREDRS